jgi:hypothetical protein
MPEREPAPTTVEISPRNYLEVKDPKSFSEFIRGFYDSPHICKEHGYKPVVYRHPDNPNDQKMYGFLLVPGYSENPSDKLEIQIETDYDPKAKNDDIRESFNINLDLPNTASNRHLQQFHWDMVEGWYHWLDQNRKPGDSDFSAATHRGAKTHDEGLIFIDGEWENYAESLSLLFEDIFFDTIYNPKLRDNLSRYSYASRICQRLVCLAPTVLDYLPVFLKDEVPGLINRLNHRLKTKPAPDLIRTMKNLKVTIQDSGWTVPDEGTEPVEFMVDKSDISISGSIYHLKSLSKEPNHIVKNHILGDQKILLIFPDFIQNAFGEISGDAETAVDGFARFMGARSFDRTVFTYPSSFSKGENIPVYLNLGGDLDSDPNRNLFGWRIDIDEWLIGILSKKGFTPEKLYAEIFKKAASLHPHLVAFAHSIKS